MGEARRSSGLARWGTFLKAAGGPGEGVGLQDEQELLLSPEENAGLNPPRTGPRGLRNTGLGQGVQALCSEPVAASARRPHFPGLLTATLRVAETRLSGNPFLMTDLGPRPPPPRGPAPAFPRLWQPWILSLNLPSFSPLLGGHTSTVSATSLPVSSPLAWPLCTNPGAFRPIGIRCGRARRRSERLGSGN